MRDHDPSTCSVCQALGDWTTTPDTEAWLEAHNKAGVIVKLQQGILPGPPDSVVAVEQERAVVLIDLAKTGEDKTAALLCGYMMTMAAGFKDYGITPRDCLLAGLIFNAQHIAEGQPLLVIEMPCGEKAVYNKKEDLPDGTAPCSCGDPSHYFVKFEWAGEE